MTEAPERIWAVDGETPYYYVPDEVYPSAAVAYVRADLLTAAQERIAALEARVVRLTEALGEARLAIDAGWTVHEGDIVCYETDFILHQSNRIDAALVTQEDRDA